MRLLLDTHIVLWWLADDRRLPSAAKSAMADAGNELFASAAVGYEIAYKQNLHRLPQLPGRLQDRLQRGVIETLPISLGQLWLLPPCQDHTATLGIAS